MRVVLGMIVGLLIASVFYVLGFYNGAVAADPNLANLQPLPSD